MKIPTQYPAKIVMVTTVQCLDEEDVEIVQGFIKTMISTHLTSYDPPFEFSMNVVALDPSSTLTAS